MVIRLSTLAPVIWKIQDYFNLFLEMIKND